MIMVVIEWLAMMRYVYNRPTPAIETPEYWLKKYLAELEKKLEVKPEVKQAVREARNNGAMGRSFLGWTSRRCFCPLAERSFRLAPGTV